MAHIDTQYQTLDSRIGIEVKRHNGAWADAESVFVHPNEDASAKILAMSARLVWYRETYDFEYRLVSRITVTQHVTEVLDEVDVETGSALVVPDDLSGLTD